MYKNSKVIALYCNLWDEVDTISLIKDSLKAGKKVVLPVINRCDMSFYEIKSLDDLIDSNNDIVKKIRYAVPTEVKYYDIKNFIKASNDTSIVFHSDELLMTGDVSRQIVEGILYERFKKEYYYFKVPHHGTAPYFSHLLPRKVVYAMCPIGQNKEYKIMKRGK